MADSYVTYTQTRREPTMTYTLLFIACTVGVAIVLSGVAVSKTNDLSTRVDNLVASPSGVSTGAATTVKAVSSKAVAPPADFINKAATAVTLHPVCQQNLAHCADQVEALHRLTNGLTCDAVRQGLVSFGSVDVTLSHNGQVQCSNNKAREGAPAPSGDCEVEVNGVCVYKQGQGLSVVLKQGAAALNSLSDSMKARRGGGFDATAGYNQQSGFTAQVGFHYNF
jgi:hypothetical protein